MNNLILTALIFIAAPTAGAEPLDPARAYRREIVDKITAVGVPRRGIEMIFDFRDRHMGAEFVTDIYRCVGFPADDARGCDEKQRFYTTRKITIRPHRYAVYVDFKIESHLKRFWLIDLEQGEAELKLVAHGSGIPRGGITRFGNRRDSRLTSLGMYVAGEMYRSNHHGIVMRMHGLDRSNSNAYVRDVIFHGARYVPEDISARKVGESWGCPAVDQKFADRVMPLLKNGALMLLDHEDLLDAAQSGEEVSLKTIGKMP